MNDKLLFLKNIFNLSKVTGSFIHSFKHTTLFYVANFLLQIITTPFITRIYSPEAYGTFSLLNTVALYLSILFTFQLEPTLILQKEEQDVQQVAGTIYTISLYWLGVSSLLFLLCGIFAELMHFKFMAFPSFMLLAPIAAFILALNNIFGNLSNRLMRYEKVFRIATPAFLISKVFTIFYGLSIRNNFSGLFLGEYILKLGTVLIGFPLILGLKAKETLKIVPISAVWVFCKQHRSYLLFEMPSRFVLTLAGQIPIFFIAFYFGRSDLGQYALAITMLEVPIRLFSYSIGAVFFRKSSEIINENQPLMSRSVKLLISLILLGILPFIFLAIFSVDVFTLFFGSQWVLAGQISSVLCLSFFSRFVCDPFQMLFRPLNKLRLYFILIMLMSILQLGYFLIVTQFTNDMIQVMLGYSILTLILNGIITARVFKFIAVYDKELTFRKIDKDLYS